MVLSTGDPAPDVSATNQHGESVSPDFDEPTVVYFYPRDDTPGCTLEANQFAAEHETYRDAGLTVYGVSTDDVDSHERFAEDNDLDFDLLADPEGEVANAFGLDVEDDFVARTTFVLADGEVESVYESVDPDGHARAVLEDADESGLVALDG
ncbi:peroxiredoxin [Halococcus hamelinensis]|uniref:thioredoxin-dependent peroxiredoxin n=1 Tax=Halococcus hamelinensis 100A6 TaxID=1132509 RepID=M0M2V3_9EURY|nr:peroxiredoxin [Halococcus hamelinensis]EMA40142.1 alkyl hydroperoxide reductase/ thiol specific antioxidant/ Mal allergen [Halococcus hamelinensis 100A6]